MRSTDDVIDNHLKCLGLLLGWTSLSGLPVMNGRRAVLLPILDVAARRAAGELS